MGKNLLIATQKVDMNDDVLGFAHRWFEEFAKNWETVTIICLYKGQYSLPPNVRVFSLGKEEGRTSRLGHALRFLGLIWRERSTYDSVFVHMNPEYVFLGGILWKLLGKKVSLWYAHRSVNLYLRVAVFFSDIIFTAAPESVSFKSIKVNCMGHGVDLTSHRCPGKQIKNTFPVVVTVGRITPIKNCEILLEATAFLHKELDIPCKSFFIGPAKESDRPYEISLKKRVEELSVSDSVVFTGSVSFEELHRHYCAADIVVNMVSSGGLDKAVIEGMAGGALVVVSNKAFREYFGAYADRLMFAPGDSRDLASKIASLWKSTDREEVRQLLLKNSDRFDVKALIKKLSISIKELR